MNGLLRISAATPIHGFRLRFLLTDAPVIERDVEPLVVGSISTRFARIPAPLRHPSENLVQPAEAGSPRRRYA